MLTQSNSLLSLLNTAHRPLIRGSPTFLVPHFGTSKALSKIFLVRFRLPRGISETNSQFFQIFLATEELFSENLASKLWGIKGLAWRLGGGGYAVLIVSRSPCPPVPSFRGASVLPWACPVGLSDSQRQGKTSALPLPSLVPCNQFSPQNGLLYYTGRENGSTGLKWASVGLLLYCLRACPVKKGRKGEISASVALTCSACLCSACSACLVLCDSDRQRQEKRPCVWVALLVWCGVSP